MRNTNLGGHTVKVNVPANAKFTDTTYNLATQSANGLQSAADKKKLDSLISLVQHTVSATSVTAYVDKQTAVFGILNIGGDNIALGTPDYKYTYCTGFFIKRASGSATTSKIILYSRMDAAIVCNTKYNGGAWTGFYVI